MKDGGIWNMKNELELKFGQLGSLYVSYGKDARSGLSVRGGTDWMMICSKDTYINVWPVEKRVISEEIFKCERHTIGLYDLYFEDFDKENEFYIFHDRVTGNFAIHNESKLPVATINRILDDYDVIKRAEDFDKENEFYIFHDRVTGNFAIHNESKLPVATINRILDDYDVIKRAMDKVVKEFNDRGISYLQGTYPWANFYMHGEYELHMSHPGGFSIYHLHAKIWEFDSYLERGTVRMCARILRYK